MRFQRAEALMNPEADALVAPGVTYESISEQVTSIVLTRPTPLSWLIIFAAASLLLMVFLVAVTYLLAVGVGIWGIQIPVAWGFAITNFVWWIGIGHAGTLISAILVLMRQKWRNSINRFAEAMTLFAVTCAGLFPLLHLGRPWFFYWLFPYPNTMDIWPQFRSPLVWDCFAVGTYFTVSLIFWYIGLIPDLATTRDRARNRLVQVIFGMLAMGWRGSARHWKNYERAYLLLAALATPLVVSVHSVVSLDFTAAILPGWHSTIFPPYFVAGAIFSGLAMVLTLAIPLRAIYGLHNVITLKHLDNCAKLLLVTGLIVAYGYVMETFMAYYSGNTYERSIFTDRMFGAYKYVYWLVIFCNVIAPQVLWSKRMRRNVVVLFIESLIVNVGMWSERYVIIIQSLHHDFLPSSWQIFHGTVWDWATFIGTIGLFFFLFCLFVRLVPMIPIFEVKELLPKPEASKNE